MLLFLISDRIQDKKLYHEISVLTRVSVLLAFNVFLQTFDVEERESFKSNHGSRTRTELWSAL